MVTRNPKRAEGSQAADYEEEGIQPPPPLPQVEVGKDLTAPDGLFEFVTPLHPLDDWTVVTAIRNILVMYHFSVRKFGLKNWEKWPEYKFGTRAFAQKGALIAEKLAAYLSANGRDEEMEGFFNETLEEAGEEFKFLEF